MEAHGTWPTRMEHLEIGVRSAMDASQVPGKGPTDVDDALHLHIN